MRRWIIPTILTVVLAVPLSILFLQVDLTPILASEQGQSVDDLLRLLFVLSAIVFSLVMSFLLYSVVVFRRRPGDTGDATPVFGNHLLEATWTIVPLVIVLILAGIGTSALLRITRAAPEAELEVQVTGMQWSWSFTYPEQGFSSSTLVLPVDQPVLFQIRSADVIHSFWVPEFRVKVDAIPGAITELRVTPTEVGDYRAYCSELCGTAHAYMTAPVQVVEPDAFEAWVAEQQQEAQAEQSEVEMGQRVAREAGCLGCHSTDGSVLVGPSFQGLFGSTRTFQDGSTAVANGEYLRESIENPGARLVQGFSNVMPGDYGERLSAGEIDALVEFIRSVDE